MLILWYIFQDVSAKIMSFSQNGPKSVCILSANGAISNVTLHQAATSGGTVTYEVRQVTLFCHTHVLSRNISSLFYMSIFVIFIVTYVDLYFKKCGFKKKKKVLQD